MYDFQCGTGGEMCVDCPTGFSCCPLASGIGGSCVSGTTCP
jgi:hypothetical protein